MDEALTIVVGYDGSDAARRALARVRGLGERASKVIVVAVATDLHSAGLGSPLADGPIDTRRLLDEALDLLGPPERIAVEVRMASGDPAVVLVEIARDVAADLLIVGKTRRRLRRANPAGVGGPAGRAAGPMRRSGGGMRRSACLVVVVGSKAWDALHRRGSGRGCGRAPAQRS